MIKMLWINLISIIFAIGAVLLAFSGKPNWGWFIVGAIICFVYPSKIRKAL
jgi:hypothetical protein